MRQANPQGEDSEASVRPVGCCEGRNRREGRTRWWSSGRIGSAPPPDFAAKQLVAFAALARAGSGLGLSGPASVGQRQWSHSSTAFGYEEYVRTCPHHPSILRLFELRL